MSANNSSISGIRDLYGDDIHLYNNIVSLLSQIALVYNYKELKTSTIDFESTINNLGKGTDIINKEIYKVSHIHQSANDSSLVLRPEFTCQIRRFCSKIIKSSQLPIKMFSHGSVFRHNRAQTGRYREFSQFNLECIDQSFNFNLNDIEIVYFLITFIKKLEISEYIEVEINNIGSRNDQSLYSEYLKEYFSKYEEKLSDIDKIRLKNSPLRLLDSDLPDEIKKDIKSIKDYISEDSRKNTEKIKKIFTNLNINCKINSNLVRGLDYYNDFVFEIKPKIGLSFTSSLIGGGRYSFPDISGIGFAIGIDRIILLLKEIKNINNILKHTKKILFCYENKNYIEKILAISNQLRTHLLENSSFSIQINQNELSFVKSLKKAEKSDILLFIGEQEHSESKIMIKNMQSGEQFTTNESNICDYF